MSPFPIDMVALGSFLSKFIFMMNICQTNVILKLWLLTIKYMLLNINHIDKIIKSPMILSFGEIKYS